MSRLAWGEATKRIFQTGVDRGVLFIDGVGVPWDGLISVSESTSGGERTPYYIDGVMYLNLGADTEFSATIEAFTYPDEFAECDGVVDAGNGFLVTNQDRKSFGLAYRTQIGNDIDGMDYAYKIHIIYEAYASPSDADYSTQDDELEPMTFSWELSTLPRVVGGLKPTSHFVIDSRKMSDDHLGYIEDLIYGRDGSYPQSPRLPTISELLHAINNPVPRPDYYDGGAEEDFETWNIRNAGGPNTVPEEFADAGYLEIDGSQVVVDPDWTVDGGTPSSTFDDLYTYTYIDGGAP